MPAPDIVATRVVEIGAPPSAIWPWLVQMGPGRGGAYSYDWIERRLGIDIRNTDRVIPELQHLKVGDEILMPGYMMRVEQLDRPGDGRALRQPRLNGAGRGGSGTVPNRRGTGLPAGPAGPAQHRPRPGHREARPPRVRWCPERPARRPRRRRRGHRSSLPGRRRRMSGPARGWPDAGCPRRGGPGRASGILPFPGMARVDHDGGGGARSRSSRAARPDRGPAGDGGTARGGDRDRDARLMCARRRGCSCRPRGHGRRGGARAGPGEIPGGHGGRRDQRGRRPV